MPDAVDLNDIPVFLKVAETGSFTAAAGVLGLPKTTVSRRVAKLESAIGVRLIQRTTRSLSLTDVGRTYYRDCREALDVVADASRRSADTQQEPSGTVRVSGPADTGFLAEIVADFMTANPKVRVELVLTDDHLNLVEEGVDVGIRAGNLSDSSLVARKLAPSRRVFVAAPAYLVRAGEPTSPADLIDHDCVVFGRTLEGATWPVQGPDGPETVPIHGRIAVNTMQSAVQAAIHGLGVALIPSPLAAEAVRTGRLRRVLRAFEPPHGGLYAVYPSNRHMPVAVKAFVDFVAERMAWLRSPEAPGKHDPLLADIAAGI
ncbi:LysR family transcriptional regulator [Bauldia sp.]|uniref:LysR family transcriptional regulator n=1 Tax=Bauldia sp. TaxID=2575872 RepID=UPI003BA97843